MWLQDKMRLSLQIIKVLKPFNSEIKNIVIKSMGIETI